MNPSPSPKYYREEKAKKISHHVLAALLGVTRQLSSWKIENDDLKFFSDASHLLKTLNQEIESAKLEPLSFALLQIIKIVDGLLANQIRPSAHVLSFCLLTLEEASRFCKRVIKGEAAGISQDIEAGFDTIMQWIEQEAEPIEPVIPLDIFHEEVLEILEELEKSLVDFKTTPDETMPTIKRLLHTLKGSARLVEYQALGDFVHALEDKIENQPINQNLSDIQAFVNYLNLHAGLILQNKPIDINWELIKRDTAEDKEAEPIQSESKLPEKFSEMVEKIRLPLATMEHFGHLAATSNIAQAHVELQLHSLKNVAMYILESMTKLQAQTKFISKYSNTLIEGVSHTDVMLEEFDPLEMDRYSQLAHHIREIQDIQDSIISFQSDFSQGVQELQDTLHTQARATQALEEGLVHARMVSFTKWLPRLSQMVTQISHELNKDIRFDILEADGELDRSVIERLTAPLEHMLRNAIDHGIESKADRLAKHKPAQGRITVSIKRIGAYMLMILEDDGRGLDLEQIKKVALARSLWTQEREPMEDELIQLILLPGFSTTQKTTQISGRGVGMDIVHAQIKKMGGSLRVQTKKDEGTAFHIQIPFTSSLNKAFLFEIHQSQYGFLVSNITAIIRVPTDTLRACQEQARLYEYKGHSFPIFHLDDQLELSKELAIGEKKSLPVILVNVQGNRLALVVDKVIGQRQVLLQSLGPQMQTLPSYIGACVMGDGEVVLLLDPLGLLYAKGHLMTPRTLRHKKILVVDDSITIRKVTERFLLRHKFQVFLAKDGLDAKEQIDEINPDCILLDLEMPRMDGFAFLKWLRMQPHYSNMPVIIISSRSLDKYKKHAYQLGVDSFLSKPYQEAALISLINHLVIKCDEKE